MTASNATLEVLYGQRKHACDQADAVAWLDSLPADSVDLLMCSPPYENARRYKEYGRDFGIARDTQSWVQWMCAVCQAACRVCKGLCVIVAEGRTQAFRYSCSPFLLMHELCDAGFNLRKPCVYYRHGISGSGGPDWWRNDWEPVICFSRPGKLPWSDNTATGHPPIYGPGGKMSHRTEKDTRTHPSNYLPPDLANPGNVIRCNVGGGHMGSPIAHENEAPYPESLVEPFVRCFCPPGGVVCDPFAGSGTTLAAALNWGRRAIGCDLRATQVELTLKRLSLVTPTMFPED